MAIGRKWNIRFGYDSLGLLLTNAPASKWFDAPGPLRNSHCRPIHGFFQCARCGWIDTGCFDSYWMYTSRWSCRFSPTPGTAATTSIPSEPRCSGSPTPDSCSNCGLLNAPPHRTTSPAAMVSTPRPFVISTPTARLPSNTTRLTCVPVIRSRFGRSSTGCRYARAALKRRPRNTFLSNAAKPSCRNPLTSSVRLNPAWTPASSHAVEQRRIRRAALEFERPVVVAPLVRSCKARLHPLEVRQAVRPVPVLEPRQRAPLVVVHRVAALEDHPVDARRATQHLAAGVVHPSPVHERFRLGLVLPIVEATADRKCERGRHVDEHVPLPVAPPGLDDQHAVRCVGAQAVGEGTSRGAATDDHVVVHGGSLPDDRRIYRSIAARTSAT